MRDVAQLRQLVEVATGKLSNLSRLLAEAHDDLTRAEEAWDEKRDLVAETLKDDMVREERKGGPAEHVIIATARRQHRAEYQAWRKAKREVDKLEKVSTNRCAELSGYQSELGVEKQLLNVGDDQRPATFNDRRGLPQAGQRRAA